MQINQAQQANWLVTRILLTSSGEGSKENVSIKQVRQIRPTAQYVPHTYFSANCCIISMVGYFL